MTRITAIAIVVDALFRIRYTAAEMAPVMAALGITSAELLQAKPEMVELS